MSNLVFGVLFPLIMSLIMLLPAVCFSNLPFNKKPFFLCFLINYLCIISFHLSMKDIICMVILLITSFIYLFFTYRKLISSILIILLINVIISLGDHIIEFLFTNIMTISVSQIEESKMLYFIFAFLTLIISCFIGRVLRMIFLNTRRLYSNYNKTKDK